MNTIQKYKQQYEGTFNGSLSPEEVDAVLSQYDVTDAIYIHWLIETGGGPIGPDWYDGINELKESQKKLINEKWNVSGFVIGWDAAGNPVVLQGNGAIVTEDHNFGGVHVVASSFEELLAKHVSS